MFTISSRLVSVSFCGDSIEIFMRWERLPALKELRKRVLISFIWEKLLSTDAVDTGMDKPIEAILLKLGNIATSISLVISS